ncbi:MAG: hypothetical protein KDD56_05035, partial [Bdellovibrionales bacterium]|nr:hypothetical protein [Bdellovibrionales bacterium]
MKKWELVRFITTMPVDEAWTIWLLIAVQYFTAGSLVKSFIASSAFFFFFLSPFMLTILSAFQIRISKALSLLYLIGAIGMLFIAFGNSLELFLIGVGLSAIFPACSPPLIATLWQQNSPSHSIGLSYSKMFLLGLTSKVITGVFISFLLGDNISGFRLIPIIYFLFYLAASFSAYKIPSNKLVKTSINPLNRLSLVWKDKTFGIILLSWMLLGISNLSTFPLRTDYIA